MEIFEEMIFDDFIKITGCHKLQKVTQGRSSQQGRNRLPSHVLLPSFTSIDGKFSQSALPLEFFMEAGFNN